MPSTKQYLAGARAVLRRDGPAGVKRFYERHGVAFSRGEDGRLSFAYLGPDAEAVATSLGQLTIHERAAVRGVAALCEQTTAKEAIV